MTPAPSTYYWRDRHNFGDVVGPWILEQVTGEAFDWCPGDTSPKVLGIGSNLLRLQPYDVVWGAGVYEERSPVRLPHNTSLLALRGPMSAQKLGAHPGTYGDPMLLMSALWDEPAPRKLACIGWVPNCLGASLPPSHDLEIDICAPWRDVVRQVASCSFVWAASLHALVLAESFGIPCGWVPAAGVPRWKFEDYFAGSGRNPQDLAPGAKLPAVPEIDKIQNRLMRAAAQILPRLERARRLAAEGLRVVEDEKAPTP
jgi:pyruvyltransferase